MLKEKKGFRLIEVIFLTIKILVILILVCLFGLGIYFFNNQEKLNKTIRYFPTYNPFKPTEEVKYTSIEEIKSDPVKEIKSQIISTQMTISSGQTRKLIIYLPQNYNQNTRYNLLVMLHGSPGKETDWIEAGNAVKTLNKLISENTIKPFIAVFPDGNGGETRDTQFIDSTDKKEKNETFLAKDLPQFLQKKFKLDLKPEHTAIAGLSSGGFGALNIGLRNQNEFGYALSFSGYGNIEVNDQSKKLIQNSQNTINANSPNTYAPKLTQKTISIWMTAGSEDIQFRPETEKTYKILKDSGIKTELQIAPGFHGWSFWSDNLPVGLIWLNSNWALIN